MIPRRPSVCQRSWSPQTTEPRLAGFSIFELLVVLIILGVIAALAAPSAIRIANNVEFRRQTEKLAGALRYARLLSVSKGREVRIMVDPDNPFALLLLNGTESEAKRYDFEDIDSLALQPAEVVFFPESQVTPAEIVLTKGQRTQRITMDPLTALPLMN
ncbi:MAG: hypothetical protein A2521_14575 [Deltaproteobacteria bacterium RIFOXYD12_FULL_57_12]|nr:MAG: hypothetical protein A2521_14575 [Deltaproteobacteria bacterium RIFOXYD12_FULL_57_12]